jgi:spermidine/putrescine transport system substrate-binding protein
MTKSTPLIFYLRACLLVFLFLNLSCTPTQPALAKEIVLYGWVDEMPQSVLDRFTAEYGVKVRYETYVSQEEEAIDNMRAGQVYDVVVMENRLIPMLVKDGLLARLDFENILNFKNVSPDFRDLAYDSGNQYSIPYSWGTIALLVRTDLTTSPITRWADLWDPSYAGKVALWSDMPRESIALTLKSLGYSANSESPAELKAALKKLIALKPGLRFLNEFDPGSAAPALASGDVAIAMGYTIDFLDSKELGLPVEYILPEEGLLIWGDSFVISANSPNKYTAELFINYLLRPEISAEIVNQNHVSSTNEAADPFIDPQILNDPSVYPDAETLNKAEVILPLSAEGQKLYAEIWISFMEGNP